MFFEEMYLRQLVFDWDRLENFLIILNRPVAN